MKVPFGLCNSPAVFQRYVNAVFQDLIRDGIVLTYMDDLIIPSANYKNGIEKLKQVLDTTKQVGLFIKWKKYNFLEKKNWNSWVTLLRMDRCSHRNEKLK